MINLICTASYFQAICSFHFLQEEQTDLSGLTSEDPSESEKAVVKADGDENKENVGSISPETEV